MKRNILALAALGAFLSVLCNTPTHADDMQDKLRQAYEAGRAAGWRECQQTPGCAAPGTNGFETDLVGGTTLRGGGTTFGGGSVGYRLPPELFGETAGSIALPEGWLVNRSESGPTLFGRVDPGGIFQPYTAGPSGQIDLLPTNEVPVWTTEPYVKDFFKSLPKGPNGLVYVPVEPALQ